VTIRETGGAVGMGGALPVPVLILGRCVSGEDYMYPRSRFAALEPPRGVERALGPKRFRVKRAGGQASGGRRRSEAARKPNDHGAG
jgi:hypothetical protein